MATLYTVLLGLHNLNRWLVLLAGLWTLLQNVPGLSGKRPYTAAERRPLGIFVGTLHLQLILGLLLFGLMGMQGIPVFAGAGRPSFQWEHLGLGILAAVLATVGSAAARRATTDQAKYRAAVIWSAVPLVIALLAIPWWRSLVPWA